MSGTGKIRAGLFRRKVCSWNSAKSGCGCSGVSLAGAKSGTLSKIRKNHGIGKGRAAQSVRRSRLQGPKPAYLKKIDEISL